MPDAKLSSTIATEFARILHSVMPRIEDALKRDAGQASFTTTVQFRRTGEGELSATIKPRERIPLDPVQIKLAMGSAGQLLLFEGAPAEIQVEPPQAVAGAGPADPHDDAGNVFD